jgi:hypothetical protein
VPGGASYRVRESVVFEMDDSLIQVSGNSRICFTGETRAERFQQMADVMNEVTSKLDEYIWIPQGCLAL